MEASMVSTNLLSSVLTATLALSAFAQPPAPLTAEQRADILMARKMYREAVDVYKEGPRDSAVILNKIGIAYHQMLQMSEASKYYQQAIKANPKYAEAINNLGTIYYARRSYRRAIGQYTKALKITPNSASIYSNLGTAQFARKKYEEASLSYQKALSLDPDVFEHRSAYGTLLQERTVEEKARFHYYLAKTYAGAGNTARAIQYIRMALEEGFKERKKLMEEPEFAKIRETAEFKELMATEPRVL
jgi:tetratricopeptide (TPR) repeat protein